MNLNEIKAKFCRPVDERALISYCLKNVDNYYGLVSKINEKDFLSHDNATLFSILKALNKKGVESFDLPLIINEAQSCGVLDWLGGIPYLQSISDMSVSDRNFEVFTQNVLEASTKYKLFLLMETHKELIEENAKDGLVSSDLMASFENSVFELSTSSRAVREPVNMSTGLVDLIEERRTTRKELMGISTGFPILDRQLDGLVPGTLNVVAARPKMGKSSFLSAVAAHVAFRSRLAVLYVDTEMYFDQWRDRILAMMSGVDERIIKHGGYDDETYRKIIDKCVRLVDNSKLYHEYMPGYSVEKLVALYKKYKLKENIGLIIFDYIKEPDSSSVDRQRKEYQILGDVTTKLKDLAGELQIPALTAVQINRDGDVADSDRIARYADVIMHWKQRDSDEIEATGLEGGLYKMNIRETRRGGSTGDHGIAYYFFKEQLSIKEVPIDRQMDKYGEKAVNYGSSNDAAI